MDFDSQLPVRATAANFAVEVEQLNGTTVSTGTGTVNAGTLRVTQATDVPVNVDVDTLAGNAINVDYGTPSTGTARVAAMLGIGSTAVSAINPVPVNIISGSGGSVNVHDYDTSVGIAAAASDTHSYTPGANFILHEIYFAASGQMKVEIQWGTTGGETTKSVAFTSKGNLTGVFRLTDGQLVATTETIKIIRTNLDNQAMDVYSSIHGVAA